MNDRERIPQAAVVIGWREYVALPEWGVTHLKAKADTGARTSAIDVANIEQLPGGENGRVRFDLIVDRAHPDARVRIEADLVRTSRVRSSLGRIHERPVIETSIRIGPITKRVQFGLVCRKRMLCRMLLGRTALSPEFVVDPAHRYLHGRPRKKRKRPNV
jgi:hypothetical protein